MAWFGGVVYYFSWVIIHNIKPNHVDYYHIEGFWDFSMYVRIKYGLKIYTWIETPCRSITHFFLLIKQFFPSLFVLSCDRKTGSDFSVFRLT